MFTYTFYCKKCGFYQEFTTKEDCMLGKKDHKRRGCRLVTAPHKNVGVLARPELALEAIEGKAIVDRAISAGTISLEEKNESDDSAS